MVFSPWLVMPATAWIDMQYSLDAHSWNLVLLRILFQFVCFKIWMDKLLVRSIGMSGTIFSQWSNPQIQVRWRQCCQCFVMFRDEIPRMCQNSMKRRIWWSGLTAKASNERWLKRFSQDTGSKMSVFQVQLPIHFLAYQYTVSPLNLAPTSRITSRNFLWTHGLVGTMFVLGKEN